MKQIVTTLILALAMLSLSLAQNTQIMRFSDRPIAEESFFKEMSGNLGLSEKSEMRFHSANIDNKDIKHSRYHQYYDGLRILTGSYLLHSRDGLVFKSTGKLYSNVSMSTQAQISMKQAEIIARKNFIVATGAQGDAFHNVELKETNHDHDHEESQSHLCIMDKAYPDRTGDLILAYAFRLATKDLGIPQGKWVYVNAKTGTIINMIDFIIHEQAPASGQSNYYGVVEFDTEEENGTYVMRDFSRGQGIKILNYMGESSLFSDQDNYWDYGNEGENAAVDAMYASQKYADFLMDYFGRNGMDDNGEEMICNVNYPDYVNAFWNGESTTYGSGNCTQFGPLTSLDIVGHEFTHGLTERTAGLIYQRESGALNESMSDIFGKTLEYITRPNHFTWLLPQDIKRNESVNHFRSMSDPNERNHPKLYNGDFWERTPRDNYGVHINSGVMNHWFYLLVEGGGGVNELGEVFNVEAIGFDRAIAVAYSNLVNYLTEDSPYKEAYLYSLEAAGDLFGIGSLEYVAVENAWNAVGVDANSDAAGEINLNVFVDEYGGGDLTSKVFCIDELGTHELSLENSGDLILSGTRVFGNVEYDNENGTSNTFGFDFILNEDWRPGERNTLGELVFNDPFAFTGDIIDLFVDVNLEHSMQTVGHSIRTRMLINRDITSPIVINNSVDMSGYDYCNKFSDIGTLNMFLTNNGCQSMNENDELEVKVIDESNNTETVLTYELRTLIFFNDNIYYNQLLSDFNLNGFPDKSSIRIEISLNSINHGSYPLRPVRLVEYFSESYSIDEKIDFDSEESLNDVVTLKAWDAEVELEDDAVVFSKMFFNNADNESCLPLDQYLFTLTNSFFFPELSYLNFCVDEDFIDREVSLGFDVYFEEDSIVSGLSEDEKSYYRLIQLYQNSEPVGSPITEASQRFTNYNISLRSEETTDISFQILAGRTRVHLDNIVLQIVENTENPIERVVPEIFPNPVADVLKIYTESSSGTIEIYNAQGQKILEKRNIGQNEIDVQHLTPGLYFYKWRDQHFIKDKTDGKFIVAR